MKKNHDSQVEDTKRIREVPFRLNISYSIGEITDMIAYQGFTFLIFTFYSVVLEVDVPIVTIVFIIWSIFNALNDPFLGALSDRTRTKWFGGGRRRPWVISMIIPLGIVMILLFTPPTNNEIVTAIYMCFIMCLFDTIYTAYSLNHTSLYPEMFTTDRAREEAGSGRRILMVIGLLIAFILPSFFIEEYIGEQTVTIHQYQIAGAVMGILIIVTGFIHAIFGIREPKLEKLKTMNPLGFKDSLKITLKNKKFMIFVGTSTMCWYVFGLLPLLMPLYVAGALGKPEADFTTILLLIAFLSSILGVLFWSKVDSKVGSKKGLMFSMIWWALSFMPMLFISQYEIAAIIMVFVGIGLGGPTYFIDRNISNIVDEDEFFTNNRREASYYGVHAIFIRLATILVILSINIIFSYSGWEEIDVSTISEENRLGLRILMSIFPAGAMIIGILILRFFPLGKSEVSEIQKRKKERLQKD